MKTDLRKLPKSEYILTIELTPEELGKYEEAAAKALSERLDIPGFRKGQAPKAFVISAVGADAFFQEALNVALPRSYFEAVKSTDLKVASRPEIKIISKSPLKYEAKVAVLPEVTIKSVDSIKIPQAKIQVTDKEVDEVINEMRKHRATYKPLERPIGKGDRVEIDFQGFDEGGAALDKTKSANHPLFVGEGSLVPGFEDQLIGMKQGEKKKFPVKFPKDFHHEPLRGKVVHFETEIKRAEEPVLAELNDDFTSQVVGEKKTVAEFKEILKQDLHARKDVEARRKRENDLLEKLLKEAKLEVPPLLVDEEVDYMMQDLKQALEARSLSYETYLEQLKKEKRDLKKEFTEEAEKRIRLRIILSHLFRTLAIDVSDAEVAEAGKKLLVATPEKDKAATEKQLTEKGALYLRLKNNLMLEKLFKKFLD